MCITTPGKIVKIDGNKATIEINNELVEVRIDLVDVDIGDFVYCASGIAVEKADV